MFRRSPSRITFLIEKHMGEHGLFDEGWTYGFKDQLSGYMADGSKQNALAICDYANKQLVFKNSYVFEAKEKDLVQTILHEIAHYYVKQGGHRQAWLDKAREIGYTRRWLPLERGDDDVWNNRPISKRFLAKYDVLIEDVAKGALLAGVLFFVFDLLLGRFSKR